MKASLLSEWWGSFSRTHKFTQSAKQWWQPQVARVVVKMQWSFFFSPRKWEKTRQKFIKTNFLLNDNLFEFSRQKSTLEAEFCEFLDYVPRNGRKSKKKTKKMWVIKPWRNSTADAFQNHSRVGSHETAKKGGVVLSSFVFQCVQHAVNKVKKENS